MGGVGPPVSGRSSCEGGVLALALARFHLSALVAMYSTGGRVEEVEGQSNPVTVTLLFTCRMGR